MFATLTCSVLRKHLRIRLYMCFNIEKILKLSEENWGIQLEPPKTNSDTATALWWLDGELQENPVTAMQKYKC